MDSPIVERCREEHARLIDLCEKLLDGLRSVRSAVSSNWMQDYEFLDCMELQGWSLTSTIDQAIHGFYKEAYNTIRMALEGYLLFRLVWMGELFTRRYRIRCAAGDQTLQQAKDRFAREARQKLGRDLVRISEDGDYTVLVLRGRRVVDQEGKDTGRIMPVYWHAWKQYRGEHFLARKKLFSRRFLQGEWAGMRRRAGGVDERDRDLYRYFFSFDRLLDNLRLNGVLNKKTSTRALVHYNFLSRFTHSTHEAKEQQLRGRIRGDVPIGVQYDHYHSELALLYVVHLGAMHLDLVHEYFDRCGIDLRDRREIGDMLSEGVGREFGYFWFIFNGPHEYDKFEYANRKCDIGKRVFVRPEEVRPSSVRYYDDPLVRLRNLHTSTQELMTGNVFISPFPRNDALR